MKTNSKLSTVEPKKDRNKNKDKLSNQLENREIHRNVDQWGGGGVITGEKFQGIRSINGR